MTKQEFFDRLRKALSGLSVDEIEDRIMFYSEIIDDRIEEGVSEEEAVLAIGDPEKIASEIIASIPLSKIIKRKIKPKNRLPGWAIALIAIGIPVWVPLLLAALVLLISVYIVIWAVAGSLWSVPVAFGASGVALAVTSIIYLFTGVFFVGLTNLSVALTCAGLFIFSFYGCKKLTKLSATLSKKIFVGIKKLLIKKEETV